MNSLFGITCRRADGDDHWAANIMAKDMPTALEQALKDHPINVNDQIIMVWVPYTVAQEEETLN